MREFSFIPLRWRKITVLTVWKFGQIYPVSCRSWWKWMHSCVTKDGKKHLTTAQWRGLVMVFIVKECLSIILEALLNLSPTSSAHLESRFLGFFLRLTESVNGIALAEEVLTVVMMSCDKSERILNCVWFVTTSDYFYHLPHCVRSASPCWHRCWLSPTIHHIPLF